MKFFILIFCLVIAFTAFWFGIKMIRLYRRVNKWTRIKATITRKSVEKRKLTSASRAGFKPGVDYTYSFNGKNYTGHKIFLAELVGGERGFLYSAAEKFNEKLKPEMEISVNPQNPEEAVMYCDGLLWYVFALFMGVLSILTGLGNYFS